MEFLQAKLDEFKAMPIKNKIAIALMVVLSIAVIIKYYPSSTGSSMQLSSSAKVEKVAEKLPDTAEIKIDSGELSALKQAIEKLKKYPDGIYLAKKITQADWQSMAQNAQIILANVEQKNKLWLLTGTCDNANQLEYFINLALKQGMQPIKADFKQSDKNWKFSFEFVGIND